MAKIKPCPNCNHTNTMRKVHISSARLPFWWYIECWNCHWCGKTKLFLFRATKSWNKEPRTPKERGGDKPKITCLNCKHLMFSDMYGECNKQLKIVNPSDTCEFAEPKERGGEK